MGRCRGGGLLLGLWRGNIIHGSDDSHTQEGEGIDLSGPAGVGKVVAGGWVVLGGSGVGVWDGKFPTTNLTDYHW